MATPTPTIPNANMPLVGDEKHITMPWQRALAQLFAAANIAGMVQVYAGVAAPVGWTEDTTVGLPALPVGIIWIRKD